MAAQGDLLSFAEILETHEALTQELAESEELSVIFDLPPSFKSTREIAATGFCTCGILNILGVLPDGRASLCGIGSHTPELDFGDLTAEGVESIWKHHPVLKSLRDNVPDHLGEIRGRCIFRNYCLGKCIAQVFYETGACLGDIRFVSGLTTMDVFRRPGCGARPMNRVLLTGKSMKPFFRAGDILAVEAAQVEKLKIGNVIVFQSPKMKEAVVHRIIGRKSPDGRTFFVTRGDNNPRLRERVFPEWVRGRVIGSFRDNRLVTTSRPVDCCPPSLRVVQEATASVPWPMPEDDFSSLSIPSGPRAVVGARTER